MLYENKYRILFKQDAYFNSVYKFCSNKILIIDLDERKVTIITFVHNIVYTKGGIFLCWRTVLDFFVARRFSLEKR